MADSVRASRSMRGSVFKSIAFLTLAVALSSCFGGEVKNQKIDGPYRLIAIDSSEDMSISYALDKGDAIGRVGPTVLSYGFNRDFIVGMTKDGHGAGQYFYIVRSLDGPYVDPSVTVRGPFSAKAFAVETVRLKLPRIDHATGL